jgi:dipeptidyl aminopeptidase/acylaminoacyl peptidase
MQSMDRVGDPQVSPDGSRVVFTVNTVDFDHNHRASDLWLVRIDGTGLRRLTSSPADDGDPQWSPDGRSVWFLSKRGGSRQVWRLPIDGGEAEQITHVPLDIGSFRLSPDGSSLAFSVKVFPDCATLACTQERLSGLETRKATGQVFDRLMIRHWDTWLDGRRSHLFTQPVAAGTEDAAQAGPAAGTDTRSAAKSASNGTNQAGPAGDAANGSAARGAPEGTARHGAGDLAGAGGGRFAGLEPVDVMKGMDADCPSRPFGDAREYTFTPDGRGLVFSARDAGREEAWSTNFDLFQVPVDGSSPPRGLTSANPAWDTQPVFSPDGKTLAYLAMARAGFESDRLQIVLRSWPDGKERRLASSWDRSPHALVWSRDGKTLYTTANELGRSPLFGIDVSSGKVRPLVAGGTASDPVVAGDKLVFGLASLEAPTELYTVRADGSRQQPLTRFNAAKLASIRMGRGEQFSFAGWNGETVYGWVVKPVDFDPAKRYPVAFLVHGGPQGSFGDNFHYRWNPQSFAGAGYASILIDFHGSTGYGQAFTDAIRDDWGGKPLEDLQKGLAAALERYPWLDGERVCALGGSFGGYMMDWIEGAWPDRFRCLVNHDGNLDEKMAYFDTEELWFPEWEHGGTPWDNPEGYDKHNPVKLVKHWKTPMLVIHGGKDFRVAETQGLATFTALQRKGIPSRLLYFPDENHWVLKPLNSLQWYDAVIDWLNRWTGKAGDATR